MPRLATSPSRKPAVAAPAELMWAVIGLLLTILGTFQQAFIANPVWIADGATLQPQALGITCQIGAVLLVGCLGGKNAGALSQIAYLALGLAGFQVFTQGSGIGYIEKPSFGYLLGFVPGAWVCGYLAFRAKPKLEWLGFSCLCGLGVIHLVGLTYLIILRAFSQELLPLIQAYSLQQLPAQFAIVCAVSVLAFLLRRVLFIV